ncbi:MAG TPA: hypothetical protein PKE07_06175, partial [Lacibacter sp.]|nr:hypothetical protein [Lacibacter sp.]HMO89114.1 hypothetical protein [Lacibacter sp.]
RSLSRPEAGKSQRDHEVSKSWFCHFIELLWWKYGAHSNRKASELLPPEFPYLQIFRHIWTRSRKWGIYN